MQGEMGDNTCSLNFCQAGEKYISTETCLTESHLGWYLNYTERDRETLKLFSYAAWSTPEITLDQ